MQVSYFSNAMQVYGARCKNKHVVEEQAPVAEELWLKGNWNP